MDRSVTRVLPLLLLLLLLLYQREQAFSHQGLRESDRGAEVLRRASDLREQQRAAEAAAKAAMEAAIRGRCQSSETIVTLRRTPGFNSNGLAMSYDLAICGDGTVAYRGHEDGCQRVQGMQSAKTDRAEVQRLVQAFLNIGYFGLEDYRDRRTDQSEADTSLTLQERHKSVADYGEIAPQKMKQLEDMIDEVAGSHRWINIDAAGVREKVQQGGNIRTPEAGLMLLRAARQATPIRCAPSSRTARTPTQRSTEMHGCGVSLPVA